MKEDSGKADMCVYIEKVESSYIVTATQTFTKSAVAIINSLDAGYKKIIEELKATGMKVFGTYDEASDFVIGCLTMA